LGKIGSDLLKIEATTLACPIHCASDPFFERKK
jgi:hypothetical protein